MTSAAGEVLEAKGWLFHCTSRFLSQTQKKMIEDGINNGVQFHPEWFPIDERRKTYFNARKNRLTKSQALKKNKNFKGS